MSKDKKALKKLGPDKFTWSNQIQKKNIPLWTEAFDYAYKLGFSRGLKSGKDKNQK